MRRGSSRGGRGELPGARLGDLGQIALGLKKERGVPLSTRGACPQHPCATFYRCFRRLTAASICNVLIHPHGFAGDLRKFEIVGLAAPRDVRRSEVVMRHLLTAKGARNPCEFPSFALIPIVVVWCGGWGRWLQARSSGKERGALAQCVFLLALSVSPCSVACSRALSKRGVSHTAVIWASVAGGSCKFGGVWCGK